MGNYGGLQTEMLIKLFDSYCCSFYGSQVWNINSPGFNRCCVQWNKAVRRILKVPYRTHTWLLGPLLNQQHVKMQFQRKILRFVYTMLNNTNIKCYIMYFAVSQLFIEHALGAKYVLFAF